MKKQLLLCIALIYGLAAATHAQVKIGNNPNSINAASMLELESTTMGILIPRLTAAQKGLIASPPTGLLIYLSDSSSGFYYFDGTIWQQLGPASSSYWTKTGNNINNNNSGFVGIGNPSPASQLDVAAGTTAVNTVANATGSINDFLQYNVQNTNTGTRAQSGYSATADNGSSTTGFAWMGINNSTFNFPTAYNIGVANDVSYIGSGQDLYIANANNTKSIIFSTGTSLTPFFSEKMRILNSGNVGINTATPNSTLELDGSFSTMVTTQTGATYTVAAKDYTVFCNYNAGTMAVTLPTAVGIKGRIYVIKNINTVRSVTISTTSAQTIDGTATLSVASMNSGSGQSYTLQSDGINWYKLTEH